MEFVDKLFGAIQNDLSLETDFRLSCAQKKVEFYEEYSNDIDEIVKIQDEFLAERKKLETKLKDKGERYRFKLYISQKVSKLLGKSIARLKPVLISQSQTKLPNSIMGSLFTSFNSFFRN